MLSRDYFAACMTAAGAKVASGLPPQDHATIRSQAEGVVLVVADGVSLVDGLPSHAQVGAFLAAELVAEGAASALRRGLGPCDTRAQAAAALHHGLYGIWSELPRETAGRALASTIVLAVVSPSWSAIWCSGDGAWGVVAPSATAVRGDDLERAAVGPEFQICAGARHNERHVELAALNARRGPTAAARDLQTMLFADGPVLGAYVATDGLRHELALAERLRRPFCGSADMARTLLGRPGGCDDLGAAWAAQRATCVGETGAAL